MKKCEKSVVVFNTVTLEKIIDNPENILSNEELFWEEERSQKLTKGWARNVGYDIPFDKWREEIGNWAKIPPKERRNHLFMKNSRKIIESKDIILEKALPHICSFLPEEAEVDVTIHFTAFIPSRAFANEDIVMNVSASYWKENADNIINTIVHEIFHVGYGWYYDHRTEKKLEDEKLYGILDNIVNEGICTYVAYKALDIFPAPDEKDYMLLEDSGQVKKAFKTVNSVISEIKSISQEELQKIIWEECILERAYYVVGSYMSKIIDEEKGRKILIQQLNVGPVSFVELYNSIVKDEMKIVF